VSRDSLLLRMELRSNPEILCVVRGALGPLTEKLGFPEAECRAVVLAVDEALTNIIRHAYRGHAERPIELSFRRIQLRRDGARREALEIKVVDRGVKIDSAKLCGRPLEEVRPGGLGLHLIRQSMDTIEFRRKDGRNQLRMLKFFHVTEPQKDS
jgi:anti-sigma regulatory factor (Ser/Thr protein kinase)